MPDDRHATFADTLPANAAPLVRLVFGLLGQALEGAGPDFDPATSLDPAPEAQFLGQARAGLPDMRDISAAFDMARQALMGHPLSLLADALALSKAELAAVALAHAVETDALAGRAVAYLQSPGGGAWPSLGLIQELLAPLDPLGVRIPVMANGAAIRAGLLTLGGAGPLPEQVLRLPAPLIACLSGAAITWPGLQEVITRAPDPNWPDSLARALDPLTQGLAEAGPMLVVMRGVTQRDQREILARLAHGLEAMAAVFELDQLQADGLGALCTGAEILPAFRANPGPGEALRLPDLQGFPGPALAFLGPDGSVTAPNRRRSEWRLPLPSAPERQKLWSVRFPDAQLAARLGRDHLQTPGRIQELSDAAENEAQLHGRTQPVEADLRAALWAGEDAGLGALAQPVTDDIPDAAMVAGPQLREALETLLTRCRAREALGARLGPALQARYRTGIRALMTGPSGTGKTLAAAWLAGRLALPLYRVDLASVSSKYIGETEKNLAQLLARAEEFDTVLLFDEADSLFGKRTDISDSNDRFANAQTNYLLQRIETFSGISLLTSNAKSRFDDAFIRRLDAILEFGQPEPRERLALWLAHLGEAHQLSVSELNRLAAFADLTGGHIRNVVLLAEVLAQEAEAQIDFTLLMQAMKIEYRKLGLTLPMELSQGGAK